MDVDDGDLMFQASGDEADPDADGSVAESSMDDEEDGLHQYNIKLEESEADEDRLIECLKINQSRRKNSVSLVELATREVVQNLESIYTSNSLLISNLPGEIKILILEYIDSIYNPEVKRRYFPNKIRSATFPANIVKDLISGSLSRFDFSMCQDFTKNEYLSIWECLATRAGSSLTHVYNKEGLYYSVKLTHFLEQCKNLETLELKAYFVDDDELEILGKSLEKLVTVSFGFDQVSTRGLEALGRLQKLENLDIYTHSKRKEAKESAMRHEDCFMKSLQLIPQLKKIGKFFRSSYYVNCTFSIPGSLPQPCSLENFTLHSTNEGDVVKIPQLLPKLKYLDISSADESDTALTPGILHQLPCLQSIFFLANDMDVLLIPSLSLIGSRITDLRIDTYRNRFPVDVSLITKLCPNLESLKLTNFMCLGKTYLPKKLKLKKLDLDQPIGRQSYTIVFGLLKAPLLEEVRINFVGFKWKPSPRFKNELKAGQLLQNLLFLRMTCDCLDKAEAKGYRFLLLNIIAHAPKLSRLQYGFTACGVENGSCCQSNEDGAQIKRLENAFFKSLSEYLTILDK